MSPKATALMVSLMLGWVQSMTSAILGEMGGYSWSVSCMARERQNDGGSSLLGMMMQGKLAAAASVKVGRHSSTGMSPRILLSLCETDKR